MGAGGRTGSWAEREEGAQGVAAAMQNHMEVSRRYAEGGGDLGMGKVPGGGEQ